MTDKERQIVDMINTEVCPFVAANRHACSNGKPWVHVMVDCKRKTEEHPAYPWLCDCAQMIVDHARGIEDYMQLSFDLGQEIGARMKDGRFTWPPAPGKGGTDAV